MTPWETWVRRPQNLWVRKALFQIHLWTGIGVGLYVLLISVSGSAIVFQNEVYKAMGSTTVEVDSSRPLLSPEALRAAAVRAYPGYVVSRVWEARNKSESVEIWLRSGDRQKQRQFDPYSGKDLGPSVPYTIQTLAWLKDLHVNLLAGRTGRLINGFGAILLTILTATGAIVWWPGIKNWRRSLTIEPRAGWKRINWDLHSAIGFWTFAVMLIWSVTGIYVVWPGPFQKTINRFAPLDRYRFDFFSDSGRSPVKNDLTATLVLVADSAAAPAPARPRRAPVRLSTGDKIVRWFTYLHFGNFAGWRTKALWVFLGLIPSFLFVTGALMWWNRVVSVAFARKPVLKPQLTRVEATD